MTAPYPKMSCLCPLSHFYHMIVKSPTHHIVAAHPLIQIECPYKILPLLSALAPVFIQTLLIEVYILSPVPAFVLQLS